MNPVSGLCEGCLRTLDEIRHWSSADDAAKRAIWLCIEQRLSDQGIRYGSTAYTQAMDDYNRQSNDMRLAVTAAGGQEQGSERREREYESLPHAGDPQKNETDVLATAATPRTSLRVSPRRRKAAKSFIS